MKKFLVSLVVLGLIEVASAGAVKSRQIIGAESAAAEDSSFVGIGLFPPVQWPTSEMGVDAFRLSLLVGKNHETSGLDLCVLGGISDNELNGVSFGGLFNYSAWDMNGFQFSGLFSRATGHATGLQLSAVTMAGFLSGVQIGVCNYAEEGSGLQIGVINRSERLAGLQIGLLNLNLDSSVPVLPVVNFAF